MGQLGFGTWPIGGVSYGPVERAEAVDSLETALALGVRMFDTANIYGDGQSEELLGEVLSGVSDAVIVTKAGYLFEKSSRQDFSESYLRHSLEQSLQRLRRSSVDVLLLHSPDNTVINQGAALDAIERIRESGLVKEVGISVRDYRQIELALRWPGCRVVELILNMLDQRPIDAGLIGKARQAGISVIARVPLCFGLLCGTYPIGAVFPGEDQRSRWPRQQLDAWISATSEFRFLERESRSLGQAALAFCLATDGVTWTIPGMKSPEQVRRNVAAAGEDCRVTPREWRRIREIWNLVRDVPPG